MFGKAFDEISLPDLQALVDARIPEGRRLEFKRDHYGRNDEARREFAADVSSLANGVGGYLLIGVEEENGIASKIVGVEAADADTLVRAATESLRASIEPQVFNVRVRWVEIEADRGVLIIHVARSWEAPHRVIVARDYRFFVRDENGKHPMAVSELRRAFLFASEVEERIRRFRTDRLELLVANEGPLALDDASPRLILHVVPQAAFADRIQLRFDQRTTGIQPLGASGSDSMYSLDGLVTYSGPEEQFESVRAFSTLFRNGVVEAVARIHVGKPDGQRRSLSLAGVEEDVIPGVGHILSELRRLSVPPPHYLMLSLTGVRGLSAQNRHGGLSYPYRSDQILLPEFMIDEKLAKVSPSTLLRPVFDLMWNAFGHKGSPSYDPDGNYRRR
jgi:hypothetical protein